MRGFSKISHCSRTIVYFSYCIRKDFCGGQGLDGGDKFIMLGDPPISLPQFGYTLDRFNNTGKLLDQLDAFTMYESMRLFERHFHTVRSDEILRS